MSTQAQKRTPDQRVAQAAIMVAAKTRVDDERSAVTRVQQARSVDKPARIDPTDESFVAWVVIAPVNPQQTVNLDFGSLQLRVGTVVRDRALARDVMFALGGAEAAAEYLRPLTVAQLAEADGPAITSMPFVGDVTNTRPIAPSAPPPLTTEQRVRALEANVAKYF